MKILSSKNRIVRTFSGYIIIILIPLIILMYKGSASLNENKRRIEESIKAELRKIGVDFDRDLSVQWEKFCNKERYRKFFEYQPLIIPDEEKIKNESGSAVQRSPLYQTVAHLNNLVKPKESELLANLSPPSLEEVLTNSLVGYFQFSPYTRAMVTPYDLNQVFYTPDSETQMIARYHRFRDEHMEPMLADKLDLDNNLEIRVSDILRLLKTRRIEKAEEPIKNILAFRELYPRVPSIRDTVVVSYYDFTYSNHTVGDDQYFISFRPILVDDSILIQGFLFDVLQMIKETQAFLEPYQRTDGNVVAGGFPPIEGHPLSPPLNFLSINYKIDEEVYLQDYRAELRRFGFILFFLTLALAASLIHLGKIIMENIRLDQKKNDFISAITHELKAPLTSIIMYAEMLEEGWVKGKESTYYNYIHFESERLSRLIRNILDYSGLERGSFHFKKSPLLLNPFIEETLSSLKVWIENNGFSFKLEALASPYVHVDKDSLSQVIYNICDNAIKYASGAEKPTLNFKVFENKTQAIIIIYDNGPGIPKKDEAKIFDKFYRCENELTRESTGTGLGLALVKELIEGNGGTISVYHPPDGSGFGVKLRLPKVVMEPNVSRSEGFRPVHE